MSELTDDMRELLELFIEHQVEFLICGGHAVAFHGYVRFTMDIDVLVLPTPENARRAMVALTAFGFGNAGIPPEAFCEPGVAVTLGVQPNQVDLLTSISSQDTVEVFAHAVPGEIGELPVHFVCIEDLLRAKREADRPKDRLDVAELAALDAKRSRPVG